MEKFLIWSRTKEKVFGHTHIKKFFNNKEETDKKMVENFEDNLFVCVQILWIWSCDNGRIPRDI
jgi:hypothetical protein